jgi:hypothetical protein
MWQQCGRRIADSGPVAATPTIRPDPFAEPAVYRLAIIEGLFVSTA